MSSDRKEFVLLTEFFEPDTVGTGQRMTEFAVGLAKRGLDITVFTSQPHQSAEMSGSSGPLPPRTDYKGIPVYRPRIPMPHQSSMLRRCLGWVLFSVWVSLTLLFSKPEKERELIAVSHPPFLVIIVWLLTRIRGWEYTYIVHDHYPDAAVELGYIASNGVVASLWSRLNERPLADARHLITLGPAMRERIVNCAAEDLDPERAHVLYNWESSEIEPKSKAENWFAEENDTMDSFTIVYSGSIFVYHDLETLIRAAAQLPSVRFLIIGDGIRKDAMIDLADRLGVKGDNVSFFPFLPREDLPYSLTSGDVSLVTVQEGFKGVNVSGKLPTSLAAGQPILVLSHPRDDEARIVNRFDAGIQVKQGDVEGVIEAIETWKSDPDLVAKHGANAADAFQKEFRQKKILDEYYRLLTRETATT